MKLLFQCTLEDRRYRVTGDKNTDFVGGRVARRWVVTSAFDARHYDGTPYPDNQTIFYPSGKPTWHDANKDAVAVARALGLVKKSGKGQTGRCDPEERKPLWERRNMGGPMRRPGDRDPGDIRNPRPSTTRAKSDRDVIAAFIARRSATGKKLSTDGQRLDGHWMGGSGIAKWSGGKIVFGDLGSRAAQTVQKAIQKLMNAQGSSVRNPAPRSASKVDEHEAHVLELSIANEYPLYLKWKAIVKNLWKHKAARRYSSSRAADGFMYLVDDAAKRYRRDWDLDASAFSVATRRKVAERLVTSFETNGRDENNLAPTASTRNRGSKRNGSYGAVPISQHSQYQAAVNHARKLIATTHKGQTLYVDSALKTTQAVRAPEKHPWIVWRDARTDGSDHRGVSPSRLFGERYKETSVTAKASSRNRGRGTGEVGPSKTSKPSRNASRRPTKQKWRLLQYGELHRQMHGAPSAHSMGPGAPQATVVVRGIYKQSGDILHVRVLRGRGFHGDETKPGHVLWKHDVRLGEGNIASQVSAAARAGEEWIDAHLSKTGSPGAPRRNLGRFMSASSKAWG